MMIDDGGNPYVIEINSLPSLGEHGSYVAAAAAMGMEFPDLVNRLVEVAAARYYGTPDPPQLEVKQADPREKVFSFITAHRDDMEHSLKRWCAHSSRTSDVVGRQGVVRDLEKVFQEIRMRAVPRLTNDKVAWLWETRAGFEGGTLVVSQMDVPFDLTMPYLGFRRDPEWIYGEGIGSVWAPLTMLEYTLRSLRSCRLLKKVPLGILLYGDEGMDCRYSGDLIHGAVQEVSEVIVLRPSGTGGGVVTERRGQRKYMLAVEGKPLRIGRTGRYPETLSWTMARLGELRQLSSRRERTAVSASGIQAEAFPNLLPHRATATILATFPTRKAGDELHEKILEVLGKTSLSWSLEQVSDRPPMKTKKKGNYLLDGLSSIAAEWDMPFTTGSSVWPSVAGLVKAGIPVVCGMGPVVKDLSTTREAVERISLIQRTLLLSQFLAAKSAG
jgi:D-alanine-D-alanine ligase